jgi:HAD superfamily hydrolase (TIGR01490 family)
MSDKLIIFDLDNTILNGNSDYSWIKFMIDSGQVDHDEYTKRNEYFYEQYYQGSLDYDAWAEFALSTFKDKTPEQLKGLLKEFLNSIIEPMINIYALRLLHEHSHDNDFMLLASATNSIIVKPIAERLGFKHIIATDVEIIAGKYTGKMKGESALGKGKLNKVKEWMSRNGFSNFENTTFYSDSINDLPLLLEVSNPVAVNPDEQLRATCWEANWEIIELPIH